MVGVMHMGGVMHGGWSVMVGVKVMLKVMHECPLIQYIQGVLMRLIFQS